MHRHYLGISKALDLSTRFGLSRRRLGQAPALPRGIAGLLLTTDSMVTELKEDEKAGAASSYFELLKNRYVWLFFFGIFAYVGSEQGVANWVSRFLETYHGLDPQVEGARAVSYFWGLLTAGCLLGLVLLKLFDARKVLVWFSTAAMITATAMRPRRDETAVLGSVIMKNTNSWYIGPVRGASSTRKMPLS